MVNLHASTLVGFIMELAPHEHPELLGLNMGSGYAKRHLRMNQYDGFTLCNKICRLLRVHCGLARDRICLELTHNGLLVALVSSDTGCRKIDDSMCSSLPDHPFFQLTDLHELNSKLNQEVSEFGRRTTSALMRLL